VITDIKVFGINHAEMHMPRSDAKTTPVRAIECVELVRFCSGSEFPVGAKIAR
jgi:hypothetical protein